ncbi:PAS domain-containing protein [Xanthocytophaga agilis]|uniref:PAS domain-containing protein n=1 Tax=Xanthocytophaga agilis TaxID=3048010 RepID=A0AAE3QZY3_9BACT|nr:PAS domain-containing protein [Xanthocytophaga agilis]MDJ1500585.1 PAS domain-containing protein [Xanthocytophaga agilis]
MPFLFNIISGRKLKEYQKFREEAKELRVATQDATLLIQNIGQGKLDTTQISDTNNPLISSLLEMQEQMKRIAEEDRQRSWANEGHTRFAEILHSHSTDLEQIFSLLIKELVRYIGANQGGLFVTNEENPQEIFLEMLSCYAYDRKKYLHKKIEVGEGLVGQCYIEADSILLTDIPEDYVNITSGLGKANPTCLLLVPLKVNEKVYGVLELASFHVFEPYQISFIEKLGESIASTFSTLKINSTTKHLLELAQQQAETLRSQEEEMRQNMEELSATQEELTRQLHESDVLKEELQNREQVFGHTTVLSESDQHGTILLVNDKLCKVSKYSREELIGKPHNIFRHPDMPKELFKILWQTIKQGKIFRGVIKNRAKDGTHYWVDATISPILDDNGKPIKYVSARYVIPDDRLAEVLYAECLQSLNLSASKASDTVSA